MKKQTNNFKFQTKTFFSSKINETEQQIENFVLNQIGDFPKTFFLLNCLIKFYFDKTTFCPVEYFKD